MKIRTATQNDLKEIAQLIREIAEYEKMSNDIKWTEENLNQALFIEKSAYVILGELEGKIIGFALYFFNFSTFEGRKGLYLEDLFIYEAYRSNGYGKLFFNELLRIAKENNCGRMEWVCLNWNKPSIGFYESLNAQPLTQWTTWRLEDHQFDDILDKS
ncbi:MAG: GNAT family N-acetyltransferase [Erysipelotrichaceae bacterium]